MDITPLIQSDRQVIQSYKDGGFRISGVLYRGAVLVWPDRVQPWDVSSPPSGLSLSDFSPLRQSGVDLVLLGCGPETVFLPPLLRRTLKEEGLNVEAMSTGAACRTYNVLLAEGRNVAAGLLPAV